MTSKTKLLHSAALCVLFAAPAFVHAGVQITEIMYDLEGADGGYEWIEVTNTGSSAIDVGSWRLVEGNTNHKLKLVSGQNTTLPAGASAIIADKPENFSSHWPAITPVFDSAFSLSNTGESLALKNGAQVVDEVSYTSDLGAKGDGGSLHRQGDSFVAALPTPALFPGALQPVLAKQSANTSSTKSIKNTTQRTDTQGSTAETHNDQAAAPALAAGYAGLWPWLMGLLSIMGLGIAAVFLSKTQEQAGVTSDPADEFSLVDKF